MQCAVNLTINEFLGFIKLATKYYPIIKKQIEGKEVELRCLRPQSFYLLPDASAIETENFGVTISERQKEYFFSRYMVEMNHPQELEIHYPSVLLYESNFKSPAIFGDDYSEGKYMIETTYNFQITVIDLLKEQDQGGNKERVNDERHEACRDRSVNDIYFDTKTMLVNIIRILKQWKYGAATKGIDVTNRWFHPKEIEHLISEGVYDSFSEDINTTRAYRKSLTSANKENSGYRVSRAIKQNGFGSAYPLSIKLKECSDVTAEIHHYEERREFDSNCC